MGEDDQPREQPRHRGRSPSSLTDEVRVCVYLLSGVLFSHRMAGGAWVLRGARVETAVSKKISFCGTGIPWDRAGEPVDGLRVYTK